VSTRSASPNTVISFDTRVRADRESVAYLRILADVISMSFSGATSSASASIHTVWDCQIPGVTGLA
jgi:hypothetical protein